MKRCPQCNRVETDDALKFCRVDGVTLVGEWSALNAEAGTAQLSSGSVSTEIETSILAHRTDAHINRATAPTTVLQPQSAQGSAGELHRLKPRRAIVLTIAGVIVVALALYIYFYASRKSETAIDSVAVLPFQNASADPNVEYLSDGISEALINSLTDLQQLRVVARSTAFRYKGKDLDPQQVGRELNVRSVLTGRVRQVADTLDVQVDLVDATTGAQLWGQEYERKASDVISVKQAIAREVTERLRLKLSGEEQQRLVKRDTTNAEAYEFYLKGRYYWNKRSVEGIRKAMEQFQQAMDKDPNYALGYVGLADCYLLLGDYAAVPSNESLPKARVAVDRALQLDDSLCEAHTSLASTYDRLWRWKEAELEFKRAISLNPNYATAHHWFANYLVVKRQFDDALRELQRAQELDPLSPIIGSTTAFVYLLKNNPDAAIEQCRKVIEVDPNFPTAHLYLGWSYLKQQHYKEAIAEFQKAVESSGRRAFNLANLGYCYAVTGRRGEALAILKELEEKYARREAFGVHLAEVCNGLGDKEQAFAWLERDFQQHEVSLADIIAELGFEELRSDLRYADLVRRMGLKP